MLYFKIKWYEFETLYSKDVYKPQPINLWAFDCWDGALIVLRNAYVTEMTTVVLPNHVNPINLTP